MSECQEKEENYILNVVRADSSKYEKENLLLYDKTINTAQKVFIF